MAEKRASQGQSVILVRLETSPEDIHGMHAAAGILTARGGMTSHERKPIPSIALTTDSSFITAWSNDTDFESIFSRQVQGLGNEGDVLVGISTSGNSKNVIAAINQAKYKGLKTVVFTGKFGGTINNKADVTINVPSDDTQRIQEGHIMMGQIICGLIEDDFLS
jgi:D-sedoheptulose 7-phosphate isomerase